MTPNSKQSRYPALLPHPPLPSPRLTCLTRAFEMPQVQTALARSQPRTDGRSAATESARRESGGLEERSERHHLCLCLCLCLCPCSCPCRRYYYYHHSEAPATQLPSLTADYRSADAVGAALPPPLPQRSLPQLRPRRLLLLLLPWPLLCDGGYSAALPQLPPPPLLLLSLLIEDASRRWRSAPSRLGLQCNQAR